MVDRTKPRKALFRTNVRWRVYDEIVRKSYLHIDTWIYQLPDDSLYFVIRYAVGGIDVRRVDMYRIAPDELIPAVVIPNIADIGMPRELDSPWARRYYPWLSELHWRRIMPIVNARVGDFKRRSVRCHHVWTNKRLDDPMEGIQNFYGVTARAARDRARITAETPVMPGSPMMRYMQTGAMTPQVAAELWEGVGVSAIQRGHDRSRVLRYYGYDPARYRSVLRTLDKLLK